MSLTSLVWRRSRDVRLLLDMAGWGAAIVLSSVLRLEALLPTRTLVGLMALAMAGHTLFSLLFGLDRRSWGRTSFADVVRLGLVVGATAVALEIIVWGFGFGRAQGVPRAMPPLAGILALGLLTATRLGTRAWATRRKPGGERILVVGAGPAGTLLAQTLSAEGHRVVGFLDADPTRKGLILANVPVVGRPEEAVAVAGKYSAKTVILATTRTPEGWQAVRHELEAVGIRCRIVPGLDDLLLAQRPSDIQAAIRRFTESGRPANILVIGGAGYIGSALVPILLRKGYQVRVLDLLLYGKEPLAPVLDHPRFELLQGDFRNVSRLVEAMQGIDTVVHLGAIVGDPACALNEELTVETNLMATKLVADVAKGHGIRRFVFASTCSVYGASDGILDEGSPLNPVSLYARTKIAAERVLLRLKDDAFRPIILRFGTVYGFSGRTRFDLVINLLAAKAATDGKITLHGGDQWRPFIHVHDVANGVAQVLETPGEKLRHDVYNVGSDEQNYTLQGAAEVIHRVVPSSQIVELGAGADRRNYRVSFKRIRDDVGFAPEWTVEGGVRQVVEAIRSGKVTDLQDPRYSNVKFLTTGGMEQFDKRVYGMVLDALEESIPAAATG